MIDTLAIAQSLEDAGLEKRPAEAIAKAIRNGQEETVTQDFFRGEIGELRAETGELRGEIGELRAEIGQLRGEMGEAIGSVRAEMGEFRGEMRAAIGELRGEMRAAIGELRGEMRAESGSIRTEMSKRFNTMQRWNMGLLFGIVAAVLAQFVFLFLQQ